MWRGSSPRPRSPAPRSRLEALGISTDFLPGVLTARKIEAGIRFGLGSTLAVSRAALTAAGGLEPLVDYLADDYEIECRQDTYTQDYILWITAHGSVQPLRITREEFLEDLAWVAERCRAAAKGEGKGGGK